MYVTKQYDKEDLLIYRLYLCILSGSMDNNANDKKKTVQTNKRFITCTVV